jgi:hypothetical protein
MVLIKLFLLDFLYLKFHYDNYSIFRIMCIMYYFYKKYIRGLAFIFISKIFKYHCFNYFLKGHIHPKNKIEFFIQLYREKMGRNDDYDNEEYVRQ